ncbi:MULTISPECIES: adenine nucleotide alpha hydrolase family protein [Haloferacaceae]|jgi:hypothetical protein|uniref:Universal stress protein family protein n=1 Tax=Halohasta litchfieldiae TaxID=1073996 RepID=A0A1H6VHP1_9EURY|nr:MULTISPECIES: hypothetical protein [Halorubraceae]SEJ03206.1 hypothetical protein SAMN05444271_11718 [Halohasta litchfieldiae]
MPDATVSAASTVQPDNSDYRVMLPLSNPRTEKNLIKLGSLLAKAKGGNVVATHIVQLPDQTPLHGGSEHVDRIDADRRSNLSLLYLVDNPLPSGKTVKRSSLSRPQIIISMMQARSSMIPAMSRMQLPAMPRTTRWL